MPGMRCTVAVCNNSRINVDKSEKEVSFYRFPKNEEIRQLWVQRCRRDGKWNPDNCRICSEHFCEEDYEEDLQARLLNLPTKKKLKATAVPSLKLRKEVDAPPKLELERSRRAAKRTNKLLVQDILAKRSKDSGNHTVTSEEVNLPTCSSPPPVPLLQIPDEDKEYERLQKKYEELVKENEEMKKQLVLSKDFIENLKLKVKSLEKDLANLTAKYSMENSDRIQIENALKHFLSKAQQDVVIGRKKKVIWSSEDVSKAFAIRYFSKRCYVYLREKLKYPLPGISSLQRWASKLNLRQGVLTDVLRIMSVAAEEMNSFEKVTVLQFDEVKINSVYEYDKAADEVIGPHSQMQVVMVRGLFAKWKQPIYIEFDQKMTKDILNTLINKLHDISYSVVACVSDCGGGNVGLWKELGVDKDHTYFPHPNTGHNVYFFADAPHLLKLTRNWLLDGGFILEGGTNISVEPLEYLIHSADTEVTSCHRINKKHLECVGAQRQNVTLAAQLLSHTTSTALTHYQPGPDKKLANDLGHFIEVINKWFDVFNSYTTSSPIATKKPYGLLLDEQNKILDEAFQMISNMLCKNKRSLQIFQKGILMSITSLKNLFIDVKDRYNASYIFTHRVNQDALENFFSQLRGRGGLNDHPSPLDAIYRIRMIILGKNTGVVQKNVNTVARDDDSDEYIMAKVITSSVSIIDVQSEKELEFSEDSDSVETSSSSDAGPSTSTKELRKCTESDGVQYLAGWVAFKLKETNPELGQHTYKSKIDHPYGVPRWVAHLSFGGLMEPSKEWEMEALLLEKIFEKFHKNGSLKKGPQLLKKIMKVVQKKHPNINVDAAKCFLRQRVFIRIKFLNQKAKEDKESKRRHGTGSTHDKEQKKMKKIVN